MQLVSLLSRTPLLLVLPTAGCETIGPEAVPEPPISAEVVLRQIKQDLDSYFAYEAEIAAEPAGQGCSRRLNFHVDRVTISLTTLTGFTSDGEVKAEIPAGMSGGGALRSLSRTGRSSQTLTFTVFPHRLGATPGAVRPARPDSFDAVLRSLRQSMLAANDTPPCLFFPPVEEQDNSIAFGFGVTRAGTTGGRISFLIFSLGAQRGSRQEAAHTVTVRFVALPHDS